MKSFTTVLVALCLVPAAFAANAPRGSFKAGEYEAAKAKAIETGKPIAIVTTQIESSCPLCVSGNEEVFKQMRTDYVLVIDDDKDKESGKLPDKVKQRTYPIYKSKGNTIPIVAVLSQTDERLLGGLCYKQIAADSRKAFRTLEKEVAEVVAQGPAATASAPAKSASPPPAAQVTGAMREWKNTEGKAIKAEAISQDDTTVTLKLENGKVVDYPLEKLSEDSRRMVSELLGAN